MPSQLLSMRVAKQLSEPLFWVSHSAQLVTSPWTPFLPKMLCCRGNGCSSHGGAIACGYPCIICNSIQSYSTIPGSFYYILLCIWTIHKRWWAMRHKHILKFSGLEFPNKNPRSLMYSEKSDSNFSSMVTCSCTLPERLFRRMWGSCRL